VGLALGTVLINTPEMTLSDCHQTILSSLTKLAEFTQMFKLIVHADHTNDVDVDGPELLLV
jgi:hypothetical protein